MSEAGQVLSKAKFAEHIGVSKARVSQYLKDGVIEQNALVGEGRRAQINVELAIQQIDQKRDPGQALGNGLETRLIASGTGPAAVEGGDLAAPQQASLPIDPINEELKREKLHAQKMQNRKAAELEAARRGQLVAVGDARSEMIKIADTMMQTFEGSLTEFATDLAAKFEIPRRDVLHQLQKTFAEVRKSAEDRQRRRAEGLPINTEVELEEV